jgi:hypothetical protein
VIELTPRAASGRAHSPLDGRLVFAVGARRSGTFWLHRVLTAHRDVAGVPGETYLFSQGIKPLVDRFHHGVASSPITGYTYMKRDDLIDALREFCDRVFLGLLDHVGPDAQYLVERTPWHVYDLDLIGEIYPDAHFVHIIRDGRDVARSLVSQPWGPTTVAEAAEEWRSSISTARGAAASLAYYREVRYEALLADPARELSDLYEWLGLDVSPPVLDPAVQEAAVLANMDPSAPGVATGKWRHAWSAADIAAFDEVAGSLIDELGYGREAVPAGAGVGVTRRIAGVARRLRTRPAPLPPSPRPGASTTDQYVLDNVLSVIEQRQYERLPALLTPNVVIRLIDGTREWSGRGADGIAELVDHLRRHEAVRRHQVRGDFYSGGSTYMAVLAHDGEHHNQHSVLVVQVAGDQVSNLTYHDLGFSPAE